VEVTSGHRQTLNFALERRTDTTPLPTPILTPDVILDNDRRAIPPTRSWGRGRTGGSTGYDGKTYRYSGRRVDTMARMKTYLQAGEYEVSVIYRASANRDTAAKFMIYTPAEYIVARVNQTQDNLAWVSPWSHQVIGGYNAVLLDCVGYRHTGTVGDRRRRVHFVKSGRPAPHADSHCVADAGRASGDSLHISDCRPGPSCSYTGMAPLRFSRRAEEGAVAVVRGARRLM